MITSIFLAIRMSTGRSVGFFVALAASLWAAFVFLRSSITGAPPLYSKGRWRRTLHFISIALDIAGAVPAFGNLFSGTVEGIQALNAGYYDTVALANAGNTLLNPSASGAASLQLVSV